MPPLGYDRFRQFFALFAEFDEIARAVAVIPTVVGVRTRDLRDRGALRRRDDAVVRHAREQDPARQ